MDAPSDTSPTPPVKETRKEIREAHVAWRSPDCVALYLSMADAGLLRYLLGETDLLGRILEDNARNGVPSYLNRQGYTRLQTIGRQRLDHSLTGINPLRRALALHASAPELPAQPVRGRTRAVRALAGDKSSPAADHPALARHAGNVLLEKFTDEDQHLPATVRRELLARLIEQQTYRLAEMASAFGVGRALLSKDLHELRRTGRLTRAQTVYLQCPPGKAIVPPPLAVTSLPSALSRERENAVAAATNAAPADTATDADWPDPWSDPWNAFDSKGDPEP